MDEVGEHSHRGNKGDDLAYSDEGEENACDHGAVALFDVAQNRSEARTSGDE